MKLVIVPLASLLLVGAGCASVTSTAFAPKEHMSYQAAIVKETLENVHFRRVLFTGASSQLVVMSIPPGGEIGEESHGHTEQSLFILQGVGQAVLDGKASDIGPGDVIVVSPDTTHNFINTGTDDLKLYTVYAPRNHIDGRVHATKADADADVDDEAVGETAHAR